MRVDVKKFLFIGDKDEKELFFRRAQEAGIVHFINTSSSPSKEIPLDVQQVIAAIKVLRGLPLVEQEENVASLNADHLAKMISQLYHESESLTEELRILDLEIARIGIFGDFSLDDIHYIEKEGKCKIQFYCSRSGIFRDIPEPDELIYVGSDYGLDYYVAINPAPIAYEKMLEIKIERPLGMLKARYTAAQNEHTNIEHQLRDYAHYNDFLHTTLIAKLNHYHLYNVQNYVEYEMDGALFAIEGWVPVNKVDALHRLIERMRVYEEEIAIESVDQVPTYLENQGFSLLGEDLIRIYDTPSASDKDPSLWVLGFFTLFFAFIIGDAGYGLVYLAIALFIRYKFPDLKGVKRRILNLFTVLCVGCIIWGILTTSFFGIQLDPDNPLRQVSLVQWLAEKRVAYSIAYQDKPYQEWVAKYPALAEIKSPHSFISYIPPHQQEQGPVILNQLSDQVMFELALFIGVMHLMISFLRYSRRHWQNFGWVVFLVGAYLYFPYYLGVPSFLNYVGGIPLIQGGKVGLELIFGGAAFAWVGSIVIHGLGGLFEPITVIQVFADTLSYLRLYALALAGAIVSATINQMTARVPLVVAILLVIFAHLVNIVLGVMSGLIHGLRLNFIEWYHYSFEGGGKEFQPLKLLKRE